MTTEAATIAATVADAALLATAAAAFGRRRARLRRRPERAGDLQPARIEVDARRVRNR